MTIRNIDISSLLESKLIPVLPILIGSNRDLVLCIKAYAWPRWLLLPSFIFGVVAVMTAPGVVSLALEIISGGLLGVSILLSASIRSVIRPFTKFVNQLDALLIFHSLQNGVAELPADTGGILPLTKLLVQKCVIEIRRLERDKSYQDSSTLQALATKKREMKRELAKLLSEKVDVDVGSFEPMFQVANDMLDQEEEASKERERGDVTSPA